MPRTGPATIELHPGVMGKSQQDHLALIPQTDNICQPHVITHLFYYTSVPPLAGKDRWLTP